MLFIVKQRYIWLIQETSGEKLGLVRTDYEMLGQVMSC
jgi:hypothetical protein